MMSSKFRVLEGKIGVKQVYDEVAELYDRSKFLYWTRRMEEGEERAIKKWISEVRGFLIDVGCGTGRYAIRKAKEGCGVVALDISLKMIKKTVEKARKHDCYQNIHPVLADGEFLPFKDGSFDGLICTLTFDHFEDCELVASEFRRVMRRNGKCILVTFNSHALNDFKRRAKIPSDKMPFQTEDMPPTLIYEVGHSADEVEEIFSRYGFDVIDVKGCCYWHLMPLRMVRYYKIWLDSIFDLAKPLVPILKYAELHAVYMKKS